jgi:histidyl-tRNA synthetase
MLLSESSAQTASRAWAVYVAAFGDRGSAAGSSVLEELRGTGFRAVSDFRSTTLKAHLRQADRLGCRFTLILGDDEAIKGSAILRDMESKVQYDISLSDVSLHVRPHLYPS